MSFMKSNIAFFRLSSHIAKRVLVVTLLLSTSGEISLRSAVAAPEIETTTEATIAKNEAKVFIEAVKNNELETVTKMLARDKTLASRSGFGSSHDLPLGQAVQNGNVAITKLLLQNGADANKSHAVVDFYIPLGQAVSMGNLEIIKLLLDAGADVNERIQQLSHRSPSVSPLSLAIDKSDERLDILQLMLAKGPDLSKKVGGETPIHRAMTRGFVKAVTALVEAGAPLDERDHRGNTLLMQAVSQSDAKLEIVKLLIEQGAAVNVANKLGETPLHLAVNNNDIVDFLVSKDANINAVTRTGDTPAHSAAKAGAKYNDLFDHRNHNTINLAGDTAFGIAMQRGNSDTNLVVSKNFLKSRDGLGRTPLLLALSNIQKRELSSLLYEHNSTNDLVSRPTERDETENLFLAVSQSDVKTLAQMMTRTSSTRLVYTHLQDGTTPLHIAAMWQTPTTMKMLLDNGADVNATDAKGETPLYKVVRYLRLQDENGKAQLGNNALARGMISQLLKRGANINRRLFTRDEYRGSTALHLAAQSRNAELVKFLLDNGAHLGILNEEGQTPLQLLYSQTGSLSNNTQDIEKVTEILLKRGAKINDADARGNTLLHNAVEGHNLRLIKFLLAKGADANARNFQGQTPLARLLDWSFTAELARPLLENGAEVKGIDDLNGNAFFRMLLYPLDASFVKLMISKGFDINARNDKEIGDTPLTFVASNFKPFNVGALLDNGANINDTNNFGQTALMRLVTQNYAPLKTEYLAATILLLARGADKTLRNNDGKTALGLALEVKNLEAIKVVQDDKLTS